MRSRGIDTKGKHELFGYVLTLEERQPVMLIGPTGTGTHLRSKSVAIWKFPTKR
jgi:hypothetical protein